MPCHGQLLHGADHAHPLHAVAGAADDRGGAGDRQRRRGGEPEIAGADRERAEEEQDRQRGAPHGGEDDAAEDHADAPAGQQQPVAGVAGAERLLRVDHLDRDHRGEEDEGGALGEQQPPQRRLLADVGEAGADRGRGPGRGRARPGAAARR